MASTVVCVPVPYGGAEHTVNSISLRNQQAPSTASFGTSLITVWESDHSGVTGAGDGAFTIRGKYNNNVEMQVSQFTNGYQRYPQVAMVDADHYLIVWQSINGDGWEIFGRLFNKNVPAGPEFIINQTTASIQERPRIASFSSPIPGNSKYIVSWKSLQQDGEGYGAYARVLGTDGVFLTGEIQLSTFTINNQQDPVCSFLSTGGPADLGFVATWVHMGDADGWAVHFRTFSNLGVPTSAVQQANVNVWGNQMNPVVSPLSNGGFVIVWESSVQPGYNGGAIVARLYDATGNPTTGEVIINDNDAAYIRENPSISLFPTNGLTVAWQATDPVTNMISVQARVLEESTGVLITNEFGINLRSDYASLPALSSVFALTPEKLVATWTASDIDGSMLGISQRDFTCTISPSVTPTRTPARSRSRGLTPIRPSPTRSSTPSPLPKVLCAVVPFSGVETTVNTITLGEQTSPSTSGFDSQIVTVWESSHLGTTDLGDPYFTLQGRFGVGPEFQINQFANGYQRFPEVAMIDENNYMIVWQSINGDGWEIFGRLFNRNAAVGPEFLINATVVSNQERPRIAAYTSPTLQENSRYIVTWRSLWQDGDGYGTYARIYRNTGTPIGGEIHLATFTVDSQQDPEIVFLSSSGGATDDGFVAVWSHMTDGFGWSIHYRVFPSIGAPSLDQQANDNIYGDQMNPVVSAISGGGFVIVWQSNMQPGELGTAIVARFFDSEGNPTGNEIVINETNLVKAYTRQNPTIVNFPDNGIAIAWESLDPDTGFSTIQARVIDEEGVHVTEEFQMNIRSDGAYASLSSLSGTSPSQLIATWQSEGVDGADLGISQRIFTCTVTPSVTITPSRSRSRPLNLSKSSSATRSRSKSRQPSKSRSTTRSKTRTATRTRTPSISGSRTKTRTPSRTISRSGSRSASKNPSTSRTRTRTLTRSSSLSSAISKSKSRAPSSLLSTSRTKTRTPSRTSSSSTISLPSSTRTLSKTSSRSKSKYFAPSVSTSALPSSSLSQIPSSASPFIPLPVSGSAVSSASPSSIPSSSTSSHSSPSSTATRTRTVPTHRGTRRPTESPRPREGDDEDDNSFQSDATSNRRGPRLSFESVGTSFMLAIVLAQLFLNFISFIQSQFVFVSSSSSSSPSSSSLVRSKSEVKKRKKKGLTTSTTTLKEIEGLLKKYEMEVEVEVDSWLIYALEDLRDELKEELITGEAKTEEEEEDLLLSFEERLEVIKEEWQVGEVFSSSSSSSSSSLGYCQNDRYSSDFGELVSPPSSIRHGSLGAPLLCST